MPAKVILRVSSADGTTKTSEVTEHDTFLLNVALFCQTAKQWRDANPAAAGNLRDHAPLVHTRRSTNLIW